MVKIRDFSIAFIIALSFGLYSSGSTFDLNTPFLNNATLAAPDRYILYWNYNLTDIVFKLVVKNAKWVSFGFSPNGDMGYSDVVVGYFNADGSGNFTRRTILDPPFMYVNPRQQVTLLQMSAENNFTTLIFTRKITYCINSTGTTEIDMDIISGAQSMIVSSKFPVKFSGNYLETFYFGSKYAWGNSLAANGDITYHGRSNRGSIVLSLLTTLNEAVNLDLNDVKVAEFVINVRAPLNLCPALC